MTASLTPQPSVRGPDGQLVRVVPVAAERTLTVAKSALKSLGWDIEQVDEATGVIRTEPRNMNFKDFGVYAGGMRHSLDVVVRPISSTQTSISVRREVVEGAEGLADARDGRGGQPAGRDRAAALRRPSTSRRSP
jgi:hypothetical protein